MRLVLIMVVNTIGLNGGTDVMSDYINIYNYRKDNEKNYYQKQYFNINHTIYLCKLSWYWFYELLVVFKYNNNGCI